MNDTPPPLIFNMQHIRTPTEPTHEHRIHTSMDGHTPTHRAISGAKTGISLLLTSPHKTEDVSPPLSHCQTVKKRQRKMDRQDERKIKSVTRSGREMQRLVPEIKMTGTVCNLLRAFKSCFLLDVLMLEKDVLKQHLASQFLHKPQ